MEAVHLNKVKATINSCLTNEQLDSCVSFMNNRYVCRSREDARIIETLLRNKMYSLHENEMERISNSLKI